VAHLAGGDLSYGSLDDGFRHCMSKLSTLHFPTNPASASILRQLGEDPASIFVFGSSSIDELAATLTASNTDPATVNRDRVLISFHPETANAKFADDCIPKVCDLIRYVHERYQDGEIVVLGSNADADAAKLTAAVKETASQLPRARFFQALPREEFLQTLLHARMFVGNSSALLLEAPFLNCPCINVGDRQRGRPRPQCVKDASFDLAQMKAAVDHVLGMPVTPFSPEDRYFFGSGDACKQVAATIVKYLDGAIAVDKTFHTS
jgi:UDP-hydrolysing UDP-N-acetyl-D-glucosamine 2-epimerase